MGQGEEGKMKEILEGYKGRYLANPSRGNTLDIGRGRDKGMQLEEN